MRDTKTFMALPFNSRLKQRAKELRKAGILHEALLWNQLKRKQLLGLDFDRQKIIGNYIVDFFCAEKGVVIEADGASHINRADEDAHRDTYLTSLGLVVIRISATDILQNMDGVLHSLKTHEALRVSKPPRPPLADTPPKEGNLPRPSGTPLKEGNLPRTSGVS